MFSNMAVSLFRYGKIQTTEAKAKSLRGFAERLITLAKKNTLHARRLVYSKMRDQAILKKLFDTIAPQFETRNGGFTRVIKSGFRRGDNASLAVIELVETKLPTKVKEELTK